jgi:nucleoside-diphosphate-sugar epimerase
MKNFITGASGLLGSYLIRQLISKGQQVVTLYRNGKGNLTKEEADKVEWVRGDIFDVCLLQDVMYDCRRVYHCAGLVSFSPGRAGDLMKINVEGTANVVNAALETGIEKLVHVSSVAALGRKRNNQVVTENMRWDDQSNPSVYGKTKYLAELEVWRAVAEGLNAVIVNPVIILGKGNWETGSSATFRNAFNEFPWYTEGVSGFVDAYDVANAMVQLMESEIIAERFILSAENWTYRDLFTTMANGFGKRPPHRKVEPWMASLVWRIERVKGLLTGKEPLLTRETAETAQQKVQFDNSKILNALQGFRFRPLAETIHDACQYYLQLESGNKSGK